MLRLPPSFSPNHHPIPSHPIPKHPQNIELCPSSTQQRSVNQLHRERGSTWTADTDDVVARSRTPSAPARPGKNHEEASRLSSHNKRSQRTPTPGIPRAKGSQATVQMWIIEKIFGFYSKSRVVFGGSFLANMKNYKYFLPKMSVNYYLNRWQSRIRKERITLRMTTEF